MQGRVVYSATKGLINGVIAGIISSVVLGVIAYSFPVQIPTNPLVAQNSTFFIAVTAKAFGASNSSATVLGWALHILAGIVIGAIFGLSTMKIGKFRANTIIRGMGLGLIAGIIAFVVLFLGLMLSYLSNQLSVAVIAGGFLAHVVFGALLGGVTTILLLSSKSYRCDECGATFSNREALMEHSRMHIKSESRYRCTTCGAMFNTEAEMNEHTKVHMRVEQVFKCDSCGQTFASQQELTEHARSHIATEQVFKCKTCGAQFKGQQDLMNHSKSHIKE